MDAPSCHCPSLDHDQFLAVATTDRVQWVLRNLIEVTLTLALRTRYGGSMLESKVS